MQRSTSAWTLAIVLVFSLMLIGCPKTAQPPGETDKPGTTGPSGETSTPATRGAVSQVTFERVKTTGDAMASQLGVGDGTTTVSSCYPDVGGAESPIADAALAFATAPAARLFPDTTSPSGFSTGISAPLAVPAGTFTQLDLISLTSAGTAGWILKFSSLEAPTGEVPIPTYTLATVAAALMQSSDGAAESKLHLSGTDLTLSFQLAGNGPCPPPDVVPPSAP